MREKQDKRSKILMTLLFVIIMLAIFVPFVINNNINLKFWEWGADPAELYQDELMEENDSNINEQESENNYIPSDEPEEEKVDIPNDEVEEPIEEKKPFEFKNLPEGTRHVLNDMKRNTDFLNTKNGRLTFWGMYRNNEPYATFAKVWKDGFYQKYDITFTLESGETANLRVPYSAFEDESEYHWTFKYGRHTYVLRDIYKGN